MKCQHFQWLWMSAKSVQVCILFYIQDGIVLNFQSRCHLDEEKGFGVSFHTLHKYFVFCSAFVAVEMVLLCDLSHIHE